MALYFYDLALLNKLKYWSNKTNLSIYGPDETKRLFEVIGTENHDQPIELPILCLRRSGGYDILNINKKPLTYDGAIGLRGQDKSTQFNAIPIQINYQLDIYAKYLQEADSYARNLVFNIVNYPTMKISIPYGEDKYFNHYANVRLANNVEDNSAIPERMVPGLFTRLTILLNIDDAYLWDIRHKYNVSIDPNFEILIHNPNTADEVFDFTEEQFIFNK